jgi:transcriptional regulator with XRE-family HTH domain
MTARNTLLTAIPYPVEQAIKKVGSNLRVARLRRKQTIREVAEKIGTGVRAIRDAENGKTSTGVVVYAALLWAYGLLQPFEDLADPRADEEGFAFAGIGKTPHARARKGRGLSNDF